MNNKNDKKELELFNDSFEPNRPNRLCVSLSDIHLTDGTVGFQNLGSEDWNAFHASLSSHCNNEEIEEVTFILDGDVVDMIRSSRWAENGIYPWERDKHKDFSRIVNKIIQEIVKKHEKFFSWLTGLKECLVNDTFIKSKDDINIIVILGNHDKELLCDNDALTFFYEEGLGKSLSDFSEKERAWIGRMYGDESLFADTKTAPYFPFYYGDRGFRFFTTHGHWRDKTNSRKIYAKQGVSGWTAEDGWKNEVWQQLKFSPFFEPCFGDTVAAGVLSTFIYEAKKKLNNKDEENKKNNIKCDFTRLRRILDELDLYRPTYKALVRILDETKSMRNRDDCKKDIAGDIEETLYSCIIKWLDWDFTYESSSLGLLIVLKIGKYIFKFLKRLNLHKLIALKIVRFSLTLLTWWNIFKSFFRKTLRLFTGREISGSELSLKDMERFPAFMPEYQHYNFQIHGEGHTHIPLEEEPNVRSKRPTTYVNFGTWRDQILGRKNKGYRRRSVLRVFYVLDLKGENGECKNEKQRRFKYFTADIIKWGDTNDSLSNE